MKNRNHGLSEKEMELVKLLMADCETTGDIQEKLKRLFAGTIEQMLEAEMDEHLGYEKNSALGNNSGNSRNGYGKKTISVIQSLSNYPVSRISVIIHIGAVCQNRNFRAGMKPFVKLRCFALYKDLRSVRLCYLQTENIKHSARFPEHKNLDYLALNDYLFHIQYLRYAPCSK